MSLKPVRLSAHALAHRERRNFTEAEVIEVIRTAPWEKAERADRRFARLNFAHGREWCGKVYATKQVRPIFVEEAEEIVVVTVYTYFF
jgi:hypothetical protein